EPPHLALTDGSTCRRYSISLRCRSSPLEQQPVVGQAGGDADSTSRAQFLRPAGGVAARGAPFRGTDVCAMEVTVPRKLVCGQARHLSTTVRPTFTSEMQAARSGSRSAALEAFFLADQAPAAARTP